MFSVIKFEWRRMLHSRSFLLAILISCGMAGIAAKEQFNIYCDGIDHISLFYRWLPSGALSFGANYFYIIIPAVCALGFSHSLCTDCKSGYWYQICTRVAKKHYFAAKYLVSFFCGGILFSAALIFHFLLLSCFMKVTLPDPASLSTMMNPFRFASKLFFTSPILWSVLWCTVTFIWGGIMSCMGTVIGMFTEKASVSVILPFLFFVCQSIAATYLQYRTGITINSHPLALGWTELIRAESASVAPTDYLLLTQLVVFLIVTLVYGWRAWRYEGL